MSACSVTRRWLMALVVVAMSVVSGVQADDDHDRALRALKAGEILPLRVVLERLGRDHAGEVIEVELERDDGRWVYEIKMLRSDGGVFELEVDARTADVLEAKDRKERH